MADWLLDPGIAYLNHGAFGAVPADVAVAADDLRRMIERDPTELVVRRLPGLLDDVRGQLAELLRADPAGCVFVANASAGTAAVLGSLPWQAGDEVVITDQAYGAVVAQVGRLAAGRGIVVRRVPVPIWPADEGEVVDAVMSGVSDRCRLLVVDSIASPTGMVMPVAAIVAAAHGRPSPVPVLVDAAHAPGQFDVDLSGDAPDFWVGNLHKWICSPRAAAVLFVAARHRDVIRPLVASHGFDEGFHPAFDWTGTLDPTPILAVPAALDFWDREGGWDVVRTRQRRLATEGAELIAAATGGVVGPADEFAAAMRIISLPVRLDAAAGPELARRLHADDGIETVVMEHDERSWVRVCGQVYNSSADYRRLADALPRQVVKQLAAVDG